MDREQIIKQMQDWCDNMCENACLKGENLNGKIHTCEICFPNTVKNALSLIKQLTEEVNDLKEDKELYSVFCGDYKGQIEDLKAISEQYQKQFEDCYEEKAKLTEENERLEKLSEDLGRDVDVKLKYILDLEDKYDKELDKLKAEKADVTYFKGQLIADTVRKMQERLKAQKFTHKNFGELVYVDDIDQIAKEMLEGIGNG